MTANKNTLTALFQQGDVPSGADYANFIDSCVNVAETSVQAMSGPLNPTELITPRVSATNVNITGTLSVAGVFSAANIIVDTVQASGASFTVVSATTHTGGTYSGTSMTLTGDASANAVYGSSARFGWFTGPAAIVSALGTTQGAAAPLINYVNRLGGVADGSTTGVILLSNRPGTVQYVIGGGASANLWPCTGGFINALAQNAAFGLAANTLYTVVHTTNSAYSVK